MPDYSAGTASIRIRPNADGFVRDLKTQLSTMRDPGFDVRVTPDVDGADLEKWRQEQERREVDVDVEPDTRGASAEMTVWRQLEESKTLNIKVQLEHQGAERQIGELEKRLESLRRSDFLRLNVGAFGAAAFQPAIASIAQVAAGLQQVSQAGLALPGVFAGAAASIGTLVLGLSGIKDAYDAVSKAAESSGKDSAAQARASASASSQLRNSLVDEKTARQDVVRATKDAQQALRDLRIEQQGGMIDESRAILEAQKAREDLARGNYSDIRDQILRVAEADQQVIEVRERNRRTTEDLNDANAKGVAGADNVVSANERLLRSQQQVADAQLAAADAAGKSTSAQDKAAIAMGKISPNAQKVATTLQDMKPQFEAFRAAASEPLLAGKAEEFREFFDAVSPGMQAGISKIATGLNHNISALFGSISSDQGKGLIDRILGNTGEAQEKLTGAIDPIVRAVGTLTAAGTDSLPRLSDALTDVSTRFANFIQAADDDGRLDKWINEGLDGVTHLGNSVLNIGKSFTAITQGAGGGRSFLEWLEQATGRLQTFLNSSEGQNKLQEYFAQGRDMLREFMPLLKELPDLFRAVGDGASTYVGGILPLLTAVSDLLGENPELVKLAIAAYLGFNTVKPIIEGVQLGVLALNNGLIGLGTGFASTRKNIADEMKRVDDVFEKSGNQGSKLNKFSSKMSGLGAIGGPLAILSAVAIPGLIGAFEAMNQKAQESAEKADYLDTRYKNLETTLDRVTGKMTGQTLSSQINAAQNFDPGGQGGGIQGISKGDALAAATALNIAPDLYAQALVNNPEAQKKVREILVRNNIVPELGANKDLQETLNTLRQTSGGKINDELLAQALIAAPGKSEEYTKLLDEAVKNSGATDDQSRQQFLSDYSLANIAQKLGPGRQAVLAGGALTTLTANLPAGGPIRQANQAQFGRAALSPQGQSAFGGDFPVNATGPVGAPGTTYKVVVPAGDANPANLARLGDVVQNPVDGSYEVTLKDLSLVKQYAKGGPTEGGRGQGFMAMLHGQEWVHDADTVGMYGKDVMNAMWRKQIDPKALRSLVPHFDSGGPIDPRDPNYVAMATGQAPGGTAPGPVAPAPEGGGLLPAITHAVSGLQGVANNANALMSTAAADPNTTVHGTAAGALPGPALTGGLAVGAPQQQTGQTSMFGNLLGGLVPGLNFAGTQQQQQSGSGPNIIPGLMGLSQVAGNPLLEQAWQQQTTNWLMKDWLSDTVMNGLLNDILPKTLDAFGLGGVLQSPYLQATGKGLGHILGLQQQQKDIATAGAYTPAGPITLPDGTVVDASALSNTLGLSGGNAALNQTFLQQLYGGAGGGAGGPLDLSGAPSAAPSGPGNGGLQVNTLRGKAIIQQYFPWATNIGGVRADPLKWHPNGLALDVMIPGAGGNNDPTPPAGKVQGDQLYAWLNAHKQELGIDYIMWQEKDHFNHLHVNFAASGYPDGTAPPAPAVAPPASGGGTGPAIAPPAPKKKLPPGAAWGIGGAAQQPLTRAAGGPIRGPGGPKGDEIPAMLSDKEFVQQASAVDKYGLPFMTALNEGRINPDMVQHFALGGAPQALLNRIAPTPQPVPRPPDVIQKTPQAKPAPAPRPMQPTAPGPPAPAPAPGPASPGPTPAPPAAAPSPPGPTPGVAMAPQTRVTPPPAGVAPPLPVDYTVPWVNTAIDSGASAIGNIAAAAISSGMGAAGMPGGGAAGQMVAGLVQQGGKIVKGVANVISATMVGSTPGSFMPDTAAYGEQMQPARRELATAEPRSMTSYGPFFGHDTNSVMQAINLKESINQQSELAAHPVRI